MNVSGLYIENEIISEEEEIKIIKWLNDQKWEGDLSGRNQYYENNGNSQKEKPFIGWILSLSKSLIKQKIMSSINQCIVSEYDPHRHIIRHIKNNIFGPTFASISLGENTNYIFRKGNESREFYVPKRSLIVISGESRYEWTHETLRRMSVNINGESIKKSPNYKRISLTFLQKL